jgi:hypothetical protein
VFSWQATVGAALALLVGGGGAVWTVQDSLTSNVTCMAALALLPAALASSGRLNREATILAGCSFLHTFFRCAARREN